MQLPLEVPLSEVMTSATITAPPDATVDSLISLMSEHHIGCVPIVDARHHAIGIVTKLDLIECRGDDRRTARELMMPNAMTMAPSDSIARAAAVMSREGFHHLLITDGERTLVGVLSSLDIVRWVAAQVEAPGTSSASDSDAA